MTKKGYDRRNINILNPIPGDNMNGKIMVYLVLALSTMTIPAHAQTSQYCPGKFSLDSFIMEYKKPSEKQKINPAIKTLFSNVAKSYACKGFINYYAAEETKEPTHIVQSVSIHHSDSLEIAFSNRIHPKICGTLRLDVPLGIQASDSTDVESKAYKALTEAIRNQFIEAEGHVATEAHNMIQTYLPRGRNFPKANAMYLIDIVEEFQNRLIEHYRNIVADNGWNDDKTQRFLSLIKCSPLLPEASGPEMDRLDYYPSAFADYKRFEQALDEWKN